MVVVLGSWGLWQRDNETNETKLENMPVLELSQAARPPQMEKLGKQAGLSRATLEFSLKFSFDTQIINSIL